jgi:hypothetical protein
MTFTLGLAAMAAAVILVFVLKPKNGVERPFVRNWLALITVTMTIMGLFIVGIVSILAG